MKRTELIATRKYFGKTQKVVAKELGISEIYLRKIESGVATPGRALLLRFEDYYHKGMRDLFPDIFLTSDDIKCIVK